MAGGPAGPDLLNQITILSRLGVVGHLSDAQLLQRFLDPRGGTSEAAFTALVQRHGPMVLRVCRQVLGDSHDAQDAFQATFLVLSRKAWAIRKADSVASWLHGVALRVGVRAKTDAARRRAYERRGAAMRAEMSGPEPGREESWPELHEELARLPDRYREPLVLCYLEGLTTEAAAERLRCPQGTVLSRLSRGRERLRDRLTRRGSAPATGVVIKGLLPEAVPAAVSEPLLNATVQVVTRTLGGSGAARPISATLISLTEGTLHAMLWTQLRTAGLTGLALSALVAGAGAALAYQIGKAEGRNAAAPPATPVVNPRDAPQPADPTAAVIVSLPPRRELHRLLRLAATETVAAAKSKPGPSSWGLASIATAQARAGDLGAARSTFAAAAREADGGFGGAASPWNLWRVGHFQVEAGLKDEARQTLQRAAEALPGVVGDYGTDSHTVDTFAAIVQEQAGIGAREDARETADRLLKFSKGFLGSTAIRNARDAQAPKIAAALAAVGDLEAAFGWSDGVEGAGRGNVLGKIAEVASRSLDREAAWRFVREAADRLAKLEPADQKYFGLSDLAEAQARLGDVAAARESARAIGEGPTRGGYDMTDGQPYALIRVAAVQSRAGDPAGARETLRHGFRSVSDHPMMRGRDGRYGQVASAQIANGDLAGAMRSVEAMRGQRSESLAYLARAQAAAGEHAASRATFARALEEAGNAVKVPPRPDPELAKVAGDNQNMPASARSTLARIQALAGDVTGALKTVRSIDDQHYQRFALQSVVTARATAGDVAGALRLGLDESKTPEARQSALEGLGQGVTARLSLKSLDPRAE